MLLLTLLPLAGWGQGAGPDPIVPGLVFSLGDGDPNEDDVLVERAPLSQREGLKFWTTNFSTYEYEQATTVTWYVWDDTDEGEWVEFNGPWTAGQYKARVDGLNSVPDYQEGLFTFDDDLTLWLGQEEVVPEQVITPQEWQQLTVKFGNTTLTNEYSWKKYNSNSQEWEDLTGDPGDGDRLKALYLYNTGATTEPYYSPVVIFAVNAQPTPITPTTDNIVVVNVQPQSGLKMPYATPVDKIVVTPKMIATNVNAFYSEDNKQLIADKLMIVDAETISKAAAGEKPMLEFALKNEGDNEIEIDEVTYVIQPIAPTPIEIVKAQNELKEGTGLSGFAFDLIKGIPYTGEPQNLVKPVSSTFNFTSFSGEGNGANELGQGTATVVRVNRENDETIAEIEVTKNEPAGTTTANDAASFEGKRFFVYADPTTIPTKRIQLFTYNEGYIPTGMWVSVAAGEESWAKFGEKEGVEFLTISQKDFDELDDATDDPADYDPAADDANWSTTIPQGTEIGKYYVWARAAAGENWVAGDAEFVEDYAEIVKGKATFEWTNEIADVYYVNPSGKYGITRDKKNIDFGTVKVTPAAAQSLVKWGYNEWIGDGEPTATLEGWTSVQEIVEPTDENEGTVFEEGKIYRVFPYVPKDDNFVVSGPGFDKRKVFTVEKPSVVFQTTPASNVIGYDTEDGLTFGIDNGTWAEFDGTYQISNDGGLEYVWYADKECTVLAETDDEGNYPAGKTYYVRAEEPEDIAIKDETHVIKEIKPAQIFITPGDIYAHVEQDVELVFGQTLPLNLIYENGAYDPGSDEIEEFEEKTWNGLLKATMIKDAEGNDVTDGAEVVLYDYEWTTYRPTTQHYITTVLPVGTWKVGAAETVDAESNVMVIGSGIWTITPKDIKNEDFTNPAVVGNDVLNHVSKTYTSQEITLGKDDFGDELSYRADGAPSINNARFGFVYGNLTLGEDFEITGYTNNINAGTATVSIEGKGNFVGERDLTFTIDKAIVPVSPVSEPVQEWAVGGDDSKFLLDWDALRSYLNENFRYGKNIDFTKDNGFKALKVKLNVGIKVGPAPKGLIAYAENDEEADNYEFDFQTAPLNVTKGQINLAVKDIHVPYNGNATLDLDGIPFDFELAEGTTFLGRSKTLEEGWKVLVSGLDDVVFAVANAEKYVVTTDGYEITATLPEGKELTATNYNVEITDATGTLFIDPIKLVLTAKDRTLSAATFVKEGKFDEATKAAEIEKLKKIENASVDATGLKPNDKLEDVVESIAIDETTGVISLTPKANANYVTPTYEEKTLVDGKLTIAPLNGIVLTSEMAEYKKDKWGDPVEPLELIGGDKKTLADNNNLPVSSVTLLLKAPKLVKEGEELEDFGKWNKNQWHTLVLPFAVTARDVTYAFPEDGYVIVNVADPVNTVEGNVKFMLPADIDQVIPANTPFCVKTAQAYDYTVENEVNGENIGQGILLTFERNIEKYGPYVIVEPTDIVKDETFENEWGYTFEGTYNQEFVIDNTKSYLRFLGPKKWNFIQSANTTYTLPPYYGYVNLGEGFAGTREVIFTFEEPDGSTTDIKNVDFVNGANSEDLYRVDGVKMTVAPTQKGVYIQGGKKFVK